jgi:hypothetical protein
MSLLALLEVIVQAESIWLTTGTSGGTSRTWQWNFSYCKRQELSWAGWKDTRLLVSQGRLWSIKIITQRSHRSYIDRSPTHLSRAVTSPPPTPPLPHISRLSSLLTRKQVITAAWQPLLGDMCCRLLNRDQPELQRITTDYRKLQVSSTVSPYYPRACEMLYRVGW